MALLSSDLLAWREDMSYFESDLTMEPGMFEDDLDNELIASLGSADLEMPFFESGNLFSTSFAATARQVLFGEEDVNNGSVEFAQFNLQPSAFSGFLALDAGFSHLDELQKDEDEEYYRTDEIDECNHVKTSFFRASPTSDLLLCVSDSLPASSTLAESKPSPRTPSTPSKSSRRSSEKKTPRKTTSKRSFIESEEEFASESENRISAEVQHIPSVESNSPSTSTKKRRKPNPSRTQASSSLVERNLTDFSESNRADEVRAVRICRNGISAEINVVFVGIDESISDLLERFGEALGIEACCIFNEYGGEIDDPELIIDDEVLFVGTQGETFAPVPRL